MTLELINKVNLTKKDCEQIAEILSRRANEIAGFHSKYRDGDEHYGSVELALSREMARLRSLAHKINPPSNDEEED